MRLQSNKKQKPRLAFSVQVGKKIYRLRQKNKYTIRQLAELSGLSQAYLCDLENGKMNPTCITILKLCKVFKVYPSHFFANFDFHTQDITRTV